MALDEYMKTAPGNESSDKYDVAADGSDELGGYTVATGSEEPTAGLPSEGPANLAQDDDDSTHWHTSWSENAVGNGTAWYQFNLNEPTTINGLRYLPRSGGMNANGKIKATRSRSLWRMAPPRMSSPMLSSPPPPCGRRPASTPSRM